MSQGGKGKGERRKGRKAEMGDDTRHTTPVDHGFPQPTAAALRVASSANSDPFPCRCSTTYKEQAGATSFLPVIPPYSRSCQSDAVLRYNDREDAHPADRQRGIGTITSLNLEASGSCHVTAVLRSNYEVVKERGFSIDSIDHGKVDGYRPSEIRKTVPDVQSESLPPFSYILLCTKNLPSLPPSLPDLIAPAVTPNHTSTILIQNGLNIHLPFLSAFPNNPILSGISRMGANELSPGVILEDDPDRLSVGVFPLPDNTPPPEAAVAAAKKFVQLYAASGKAVVEYNPNVKYERWRKLLYNATWNPICALTDLDTGRLRIVSTDPADPLSLVNLLLRPAMREVIAVARADGVELDEGMIEGVVEAEPVEVYCQPSMLQDARKGRMWEVENLLGEVARIARDKGVETPVLGAVYGMAGARMWGLKEKWGLVRREEEAKKLRKAREARG